MLGVDGGITRQNIADVARAGADLIVTGSAVFDGRAAAENARSMLQARPAAADACAPAGPTPTRSGSSTRYAARFGEDLALRTYTSRLLGAEPALVLHGGGNTSVKGTVTNVLGDAVPAIFVKASGRDLATIEPEGHPAVDLGLPAPAAHAGRPLATTRWSTSCARTCSTIAPRPRRSRRWSTRSCRAKFVDHTHADAILALTNQPDGEGHVRAALGDGVSVLDYVAPGFQLARAAADAVERRARRPRHGLDAPRHRHLGRDRARVVRGHDRAGDRGPRRT